MTEPKFDYSHLSVGSRIARYTMFQVMGEPYIEVSHAGESNKPYFNALLRRSKKNMRRMRAGAVDAAALADNRDEDRALYPRYIVKGWGISEKAGVILDSTGNEIEYSAENVSTFLKALPNWLFDELRLFCGEESNFLEDLEEGEEVPNSEEVSGNS